MVWGSIKARCVGDLLKISGIMNIETCCHIPTSGKYLTGNDFIFQYDNDSKHTGSKSIPATPSVMVWPPQTSTLLANQNAANTERVKVLTGSSLELYKLYFDVCLHISLNQCACFPFS